jgi:hypothetical protein
MNSLHLMVIIFLLLLELFSDVLFFIFNILGYHTVFLGTSFSGSVIYHDSRGPGCFATCLDVGHDGVCPTRRCLSLVCSYFISLTHQNTGDWLPCVFHLVLHLVLSCILVISTLLLSYFHPFCFSKSSG